MLARVVVLFLLGIIIFIMVHTELPTIFRSVGHFWVVSDTLEPADAVIVLGGEPGTRSYAAAQLYEARLVSQILVSDAGLRHAGTDETDNLDLEALTKLGVPAEAVKEFGSKPRNTFEEAYSVARWAEQNHIRRIIVPTEIFTSRRVAWIFHRELDPLGVHVMVQALEPEYNLENWWRNKYARDAFKNEAIKYLYYRIRY